MRCGQLNGFVRNPAEYNFSTGKSGNENVFKSSIETKSIDGHS